MKPNCNTPIFFGTVNVYSSCSYSKVEHIDGEFEYILINLSSLLFDEFVSFELDVVRLFIMNVQNIIWQLKYRKILLFQVSRPVTFTVDASQAGEGTLELVVSTAKASVRAEVAARSRGLYDVTFTPNEPIPHFVNITFNEEEVLGMFWQ